MPGVVVEDDKVIDVCFACHGQEVPLRLAVLVEVLLAPVEAVPSHTLLAGNVVVGEAVCLAVSNELHEEALRVECHVCAPVAVAGKEHACANIEQII